MSLFFIECTALLSLVFGNNLPVSSFKLIAGVPQPPHNHLLLVLFGSDCQRILDSHDVQHLKTIELNVFEI